MRRTAVQVSSVQLLCPVRLFVILWTVACQASLSIHSSWSLSKLISIELGTYGCSFSGTPEGQVPLAGAVRTGFKKDVKEGQDQWLELLEME